MIVRPNTDLWNMEIKMLESGQKQAYSYASIRVGATSCWISNNLHIIYITIARSVLLLGAYKLFHMGRVGNFHMYLLLLSTEVKLLNEKDVEDSK